MKKLTVLAATAVTALGLPVAAHAAATYQPLDAPDPTGDVESTSTNETIDAPALDITAVRGTRDTKQIRLVLKVDDLQKTRYTRYLVAISGANDKANYLELRRGASDKTAASLYVLRFGQGGLTIKEQSCAGFTAVPDYARSRVVYTLPLSCYKGDADAAGASVLGGIAQWGSKRWQGGPLTSSSIDEDSAPSRLDNLDGEDGSSSGAYWAWSEVNRSAKHAPLPRLF